MPHEQATSPENDTAPTLACPTCGAPADPGHLYCARCGTPLQAAIAGAAERGRLGGTRWSPVANETPSTETVSPLQESTPVPRKRRRRRPWRRRPWVVVPLAVLLLLGIVAGTAAYRAQSTIGDLKTVDSPPAKVSDATTGDDHLPAGLTFDSAPAEQALVAAGVKTPGGSGLLGKFRETASNVSDLAAGAAIAAGVKDPSKSAMNILIMGVDARPGAPIDFGVRPDALMVLHLDPQSGVCRGLAVPRDTLTLLPGYGMTKISHALMVGGLQYQQLIVEQLLGVKIDRYALIDFAGSQKMVDAVGGVSVTVPKAIVQNGQVLFKDGPQVFHGDQALAYARYRGGDDVDVGRVRRQQQIIQGLTEKARNRNAATDVRDLLPALSSHVRTNLTPAELVSLADQYRSSCGEKSLVVDTLGGDVVQPATPDPLYHQPLAYVQVEPSVVKAKVAALTAP